MSFKRTIEDFTCEHCGAQVEGNGYTNHCPHCLWSKHVDVSPGDRAHACRGPMKPVGIEGASPSYRIRYHCERCGAEKIYNAANEDDTKAIIGVASITLN